MKKYEKLRLWYKSPAEQSHTGWENNSLPIGNGYIGGTVFGRTDIERVQFNEKTLWTGGPDPQNRPHYHYGIIEGKETLLAEIRDLFARKKEHEAKVLTEQLIGENADNGGNGFGGFQNFGDMYFEFAHNPSGVEEYVRELDLDTAIASVSYRYEGIRYLREYFVSYPDNVMVMRFSADKSKSITLNVCMVSAQGAHVSIEEDALIIRDRLTDNHMQYEAWLKVIPDGGTMKSLKGKLEISDADSVLILMTAGTDYANIFPDYRGIDPHDAIVERIQEASKKGYEKLKESHLADYRNIFSRVELNLGHEHNDIPTDILLKAYKSGERNHYLETLLFQYGRYLLIASSRKGSLPSNLQGIWNDSNTPPWNGDYHFDVNIQMNYWPAYSTNMAECAIPLVEYVDSLREPGRISAAAYTGIKSTKENPENGYMIQPINNPFGWTAPGHDISWGWAPGCAPWVLQNIWDYYRYTLDREYLKSTIYPMMKEQSRFWQQYLVYDEESGRMADIPSISPEQGNISKGTTYSQELAWQLFSDTIDASEILDVDEDLRSEWKNLKDMVKPLHIGNDGQIKEWYEETTLGSMDCDRKHRHVSHLLGLFPGNHISDAAPEYVEAAKVSLNDRGDENTGWAMGHRMNLWARTGDGNRAYDLLNSFIKNGILDNLWDTCPPFQIDGNFSYTSGVAEMLLQSHLGYVNFLPAKPDDWDKGYVKGLVARGNFVIDIEWSQGRADKFVVVSKQGEKFAGKYKRITEARIQNESGDEIKTERVGSDMISFDTVKEGKYIIKFEGTGN